MQVSEQCENSVQFELHGGLRSEFLPGWQETDVGKSIAVCQRFGAGVRARTVRHALGQVQKRVRLVRANETRQRAGTLGVPEKGQFQR